LQLAARNPGNIGKFALPGRILGIAHARRAGLR
jgi:hypothetical protein